MDKVTQDAANPLQLNPAYDSGDHLHPGPPGYKAMGDAIPLDWFK
jgi:lysophospholipase L1-like esterase